MLQSKILSHKSCLSKDVALRMFMDIIKDTQINTMVNLSGNESLS
jgi:hypothetical protein